MIPNFKRTRRTIGNSNNTPIKAAVQMTVVKSRLISKTLPIPNETERDTKISICHFITIAPKANPKTNNTRENGIIRTIRLYSFLRRAGRKNERI